jgi:hypothetical protein
MDFRSYFSQEVLSELSYVFDKSHYRGHPLAYWRYILWCIIKDEPIDGSPSSCPCCATGFDSDASEWDYYL